ncbi:WD40-repeat-containing domain protein [Mycena floridula]|nr:WD40-repeat-containing domain protein [Mycena floridula]
MAFSNDGRYLVASTTGDGLAICDLKRGVMSQGPYCGSGGVNAVAFSPDGRRVLAGFRDGVIRIWDRYSDISPGYEGSSWTTALSPNGKVVASGSNDGVRTGLFSTAALSPDGKVVASVSNDGVRTWDTETGPEVECDNDDLREDDEDGLDSSDDEFQEADWPYLTLVFSSDGNRIVTSSVDTIQVWDVKSRAFVPRFAGHKIRYKSWIHSVDLSPDGKWVILGYGNGSLRIWDAENGKVVAVLGGHQTYIHSIELSRNGTRLVSGSRDMLRIWDFSQIIGRLRVRKQAVLRDEEIPIMYEDTSKMVDGWVVTRDNGLLFWVPPVYRARLWRPSNIAVIGPDDGLQLDLSKFVHGRDWTRCRDPFSLS